jgi:8-oxo-dGTP pyrophosphatase MutT (NUDIX family)
MTDYLQAELLKLKKCPRVDLSIYKKFGQRIKANPNLVRENNPTDHFCVFFLPVSVDPKTLRTRIFIVNHIKAGGWIPPGGHIELGEKPIGTLKREFFEELKYRAKDDQIVLFNLSIIRMNNPRHNCKIHYDFWYLVYTPFIDFYFNQKEFYEAGWFSISEAFDKILYPEYRPVIAKLKLLPIRRPRQ